jgi:hypothetical protein
LSHKRFIGIKYGIICIEFINTVNIAFGNIPSINNSFKNQKPNIKIVKLIRNAYIIKRQLMGTKIQ